MELLESARSLRKKKNYVRAVEVYNEILVEEPDDKTAIEAVQEIEGEIAEEQIKQDYIENIKILDFEAKRIDTWSDKNIPAVRFALKNEGDKTLNKVEVTVYFKDKNDVTIYDHMNQL